MLPAFNMLAASILALAWLAIGLTFPILAVWFGVRVARDLRRIADSLEDGKNAFMDVHDIDASRYNGEREIRPPRIANSVFGR